MPFGVLFGSDCRHSCAASNRVRFVKQGAACVARELQRGQGENGEAGLFEKAENEKQALSVGYWFIRELRVLKRRRLRCFWGGLPTTASGRSRWKIRSSLFIRYYARPGFSGGLAPKSL